MPYLHLEQVAKQFGEVKVVQEMSLSGDSGEFIVLVGASGCGKSTTLRMIAGLEAPTSGRIWIDGQDVTHISPSQRNIAMVFQNYALYPHMNVAKNMSFALELAGANRAEITRRIREAAKILDIEHLLDRKPKALSGGQRQRVAMGRAIVREPKVFLFDEPLSNLDAKLRGQMRIELALLHQRLQKTTVYVTHDQTEAMTLADRIVVMDQGRIQQIGTPDEVFNRPQNRFVAGFIGSPSMNFIQVAVREQGGRWRFENEFCACDVPPQMLTRVQAFRDQFLVLGIRPQSFLAQASDTGMVLQVKIEVCEYLGTESVLSGQLYGAAGPCDQKVTLVLPGNQNRLMHNTIGVTALADQMHVFESGDQGRNLMI
jgi:ABC-type sugar transport system ATPase subunit